jgi:effector-binding domain-containing protein
MLSAMRIETIEARATLVMRHAVTMESLPSVMGPSFEAVAGAFANAAQVPDGPPFALYHQIDDDGIDLEAGLAGHLDANEIPTGVEVSQLPGGEVAVALYTGTYDGLADAWGQFSDWIEAQGRELAMPIWEVYVTDPDEEDDPEAFRTELFHALA